MPDFYRPPIPRLTLPSRPARVSGCYWQPSLAFIRELSDWLAGQRVLELFAGNGYLAAWLQKSGVQVTPTTRFTGHDAHETGVYCDMLEEEACSAVLRHSTCHDVLLMCWPTVTPAAAEAALLWGPERPIVFIGEPSDPEKGQFGGCATDAFFALTEVVHHFDSYRGRLGETACVLQVKSSLLT